MFAPKVFAILSLVASAVTMPTHDEPTVGPSGNAVCGNGQVISCCNTEDSNNSDGGLLGIGNLLGGNCEQLNIPIIAVNVPISQACGGNQAACCTGDQSGLINIQCNNIGI